MGRAPCCDKANVKKGPWSPEEDAKLKSYIDQNGTGGNWIALPQKIGLKRCGKSCRLRWLNYLRPNIKHGGFSEEEDNIICSLYISIGSRWSIIAAQLPGRTDNDIKNYWNTRLKKKLLGKQRKEQAAAAQARRATSLKAQDQLKRESTAFEHHHNLPHASSAFVNQTVPYWPEIPAVLTVPAVNNQSSYNDGSHHQESLKNLLIKLGGRFSESPSTTTTATTNYPVDQPCTVQDHAYSFDMLTGTYGAEAVGPAMYQGLENLQAELRELIYGNNPVLLDTTATITTGTSTTSVDSGISSWESEMNGSSLVYPTNMVSEYGNLYQPPLDQGSAFEESSYFNTNYVNACGVLR